jgi:hypothetical protein
METSPLIRSNYKHHNFYWTDEYQGANIGLTWHLSILVRENSEIFALAARPNSTHLMYSCTATKQKLRKHDNTFA